MTVDVQTTQELPFISRPREFPEYSEFLLSQVGNPSYSVR
jgi:hypothetical protein